MNGAEVKSWFRNIPDDCEVFFECNNREIHIASMHTAPWGKLVTQHFIEGTVVERPEEEDARESEPDTLANLGMCEADFR